MNDKNICGQCGVLNPHCWMLIIKQYYGGVGDLNLRPVSNCVKLQSQCGAVGSAFGALPRGPGGQFPALTYYCLIA